MAKQKKAKRLARIARNTDRELVKRHHPERIRLDSTILLPSEVPTCGSVPLNAIIREGFERPAHVSVCVKS